MWLKQGDTTVFRSESQDRLINLNVCLRQSTARARLLHGVSGGNGNGHFYKSKSFGFAHHDGQNRGFSGSVYKTIKIECTLAAIYLPISEDK